jgi:hypothetical protein
MRKTGNCAVVPHGVEFTQLVFAHRVGLVGGNMVSDGYAQRLGCEALTSPNTECGASNLLCSRMHLAT